MPFRDQLSFRRGEIRLPRVLYKVCVHRATAALPERYRGDMVRDLDTYAGMREETYKCIQCGKTKNAEKLWELLQAYMLFGGDFVV